LIQESQNYMQIDNIAKVNIKNPVLICGLPGIGSVGKIAVDFTIESLNAKCFLRIHSKDFPHSVFVNEDSLIDLPTVTLHYKKIKNQDFVFLAGDVQPVDERACYEFCERILKIVKSYGCREVVTMGGIGLGKVPKKPKVYITGNDKDYLKTFKRCKRDIYGVVGPIIGVTGVLVALAKLEKMKGAILLAQTFGHFAYLGIKGSKELIAVLNEKFKLGVDPKNLNAEIEEIEEELMSKITPENITKGNKKSQMSYFG